MSKHRHIHVIYGTITVAIEYNPADLQEAATIQTQMKLTAQQLPGFVAIDTRLGKLRAPEQSAPAADPSADPDRPAFMTRSMAK